MKSLTVFFIFALTFCGCKQYKGTDTKEVKSIPEQASKKTYFERIKFVSKYKFEQFPVNKIGNKNPGLKLNTKQSSFSKRFKTMINQSFEKEPINFAGKYVLNYWGCGSPCQVGIAINAENGKLIELPSAGGGYEYRKDSRLLVLNPPDSLDYYIKDCEWCKPELYLLDTIKNSFIKLEE